MATVGTTEAHGSANTGVLTVMAIIIAVDRGRANGIPDVTVMTTVTTIVVSTTIDNLMIVTTPIAGDGNIMDGQVMIEVAGITDVPGMIDGVVQNSAGHRSRCRCPAVLFCLDIHHRLFYSS